MRSADDPAVTAWTALAESDLRVAVRELAAQPPEWHQVCFHAQQAGEKALKAVLEALDMPVPLTHDVARLARLLQPVFADVQSLAQAAADLSAYGVLPRYPGAAVPATEQLATAAVADARRIVAWAFARLHPGS